MEQTKQAKPRTEYRKLASKSLLEEHGVEFPCGPRLKGNKSLLACNESFKNSNYSASTTNYSRLVPENEAQITFCIRESLREKTAIPSTSTADLRALLHEVNQPTQSVEYLSFTNNSDNYNVDISETFVTSSEENETAEFCFFYCQE